MFEAAANNKMILTSDTQTTQEYFDECQRMGKDARQWREAIRYYLVHEEERWERAMAFHTFVKEECQETAFAGIVKRLVDPFTTPRTTWWSDFLTFFWRRKKQRFVLYSGAEKERKRHPPIPSPSLYGRDVTENRRNRRFSGFLRPFGSKRQSRALVWLSSLCPCGVSHGLLSAGAWRRGRGRRKMENFLQVWWKVRIFAALN